MAGAFDGQQRQRAARLGDRREQQPDATRHAGDAADEQAGDRDVGRERHAADRRQQRERHAEREHGDADRERMPLRRSDRESLQGLRRRDALGAARRQPAADERGDDAERTVERRAGEVEAQRRSHAGEIAAAEVAAEEAQCRRREPGAEGQAEQRADRAEQRRFGQDEAEPLSRRKAEDGEQGELLLALRDREREDREDQESAGEHRHERQHGEIHAVGARHVRDPLARLVAGRHAHAFGQAQRGERGGAVGARREADFDPVQPADAAERLLRAGDVDHGKRRPAGGDAAGDARLEAAGSRLHLDRRLAS